MAKKNQHVVPLGGGWAVKGEGNEKFTVITDTKNKALIIARGIARNNKSELIIHGKDGKIMDKDSYGNDPYPPKDKKH
ncbi:MAG: DUF2188 domain-containing protein [Ignavibacteria bacterium]|nr:DUF2188 domain-containing protein [Ignavibacteria bacterium]MCC7159053.1 DUF2188 domain-containing protein [Ignavibacteria bacterium]